MIDDNYSYIKQVSILVVSFFSNLFSAISGGGAGLIQLPALLIFGIPYLKALASHKMATVALGIGSSIRNISSLRDDISIISELLIIGIPGVIIGSNLVNLISDNYLYVTLGIFSIFIGIYSIKKPNFGLNSDLTRISFSRRLIYRSFVFFIGIINGSISSGSGLLVTILLIKTFKIDFLRAVSLTLFSVGIFWNLSGAITLSRIGNLEYDILIVLLIGSFSGGYLGAHLSNLKGNKLIKQFFNFICLSVGLTLLIKGFRLFIAS